MAGKSNHRGFGNVRKLPGGRWQASYRDPHGMTYVSASGNPRRLRYNAPNTFDTRDDAEAWLVEERRLISAGDWTTPAERATQRRTRVTFGEYATAWLAGRKVKGQPLADRTREHYEDLLESHIRPTFSDVPLTAITPEAVDHWYELCAIGRPTTQAHAYSLLRTILGTAVDRGLIKTANPAKVRGGGSTTRAKKIRPATLAELETIVQAMPAERRLMVLLAAWCAPRVGGRAALRRPHRVGRKESGGLHRRRGVVRSRDRGRIAKTPKSEAGKRDVAIPPHLLPLVRAHLLEHTGPGKDGLLFPGQDGSQLAPSTLYGRAAVLDEAGDIKRAGWGWYEARRQADREDLRFHDLRHTGATLAAQTGATLAELMGRLGHSTPAAALRYQHAAAERDQAIAKRLSLLAEGRAE